MNFASRETHESKSQPGVTFTVRRLNQIQRARRDMKIVEHNVKFSQIVGRLKTLEFGTFDYDVADHELGIVLNMHIKPATITAGLIGIEGLEIDGKAVTVSNFLEDGPEALLDEVWEACAAASTMSGEQQKNSQSPSASLGPEVGSESNTIAMPVNGLATSAIETAGGTSPAT